MAGEQGNSFDHDRWMKDKYGEEDLIFLSPNEYQQRWQDIEQNILVTINRYQRESKRKFKKDYEIAGALVFGGYARGQIHNNSDFDMFTIVFRDPASSVMEFIDEIEKATHVHVEWLGNIKTSET